MGVGTVLGGVAVAVFAVGMFDGCGGGGGAGGSASRNGGGGAGGVSPPSGNVDTAGSGTGKAGDFRGE